jgi:hypothetical protein
VTVPIITGQRDWAGPIDRRPNFHHLPLPMSRQSSRGVDIFNVFPRVENLQDASDYNEAWGVFMRSGRPIPEVFTRLYNHHLPGYPDVTYIRSAVMGYAVTRRIIQANPSLNHDVVNAFLITLAAFQRQRRLPIDAWVQILNSRRDTPVNNWSLFDRILQHRAFRSSGFGITFVPPDDTGLPWNVRTTWTMDRFMSFLMLIRPSAQSFRWLVDYADAYVRTRPVGGIVGNISVSTLPRGRLYLAPFTSAPPYSAAFASAPAPAAETATHMDVDTPTPSSAPPSSTQPPDPPA